MVDNATLKNPNGLLPELEKTTELSGEKRTWTGNSGPKEGTYTLQAIVDARMKENSKPLVEGQDVLVGTTKSVQQQNSQSDKIDEDEDVDNDIYNSGAEEADEENTRMALNQKQLSLAKKESAEKKEKEGLSFGWFMIALIIALLFDGIGFIPGIGQIAAPIITPIGLMIIWLMHVFSGVPFDTKAKSRVAMTGIIEFIPILQVIPALTACVLLSKAMPMLEKRALSVANKLGGEQAGKLMQNKIAHPNSAIMNTK